MVNLEPPSPSSILLECLSVDMYQSLSNQSDYLSLKEGHLATMRRALDAVIQKHELVEEYEVCAKVLKFKNNLTSYV